MEPKVVTTGGGLRKLYHAKARADWNAKMQEKEKKPLTPKRKPHQPLGARFTDDPVARSKEYFAG